MIDSDIVDQRQVMIRYVMSSYEELGGSEVLVEINQSLFYNPSSGEVDQCDGSEVLSYGLCTYVLILSVVGGRLLDGEMSSSLRRGRFWWSWSHQDRLERNNTSGDVGNLDSKSP